MIHSLYVRFIQPIISQWRIYSIHYNLLPKFFVFQFIRFIWCSIQHVYWEYKGYNSHIRACKRGECYELSAHVQSIHCHCKAIPTDKVRSCQFIISHHHFSHPEVVLKDSVHIVDIDKDGGYFLEFKNPLEHYSASKVPFLWTMLGHEAIRLIWLPLESCRKLATQLGDPSDRGHRVTYFFNSGRCGSTLMATIADKADSESLVLSEPPVLMSLYILKLRMRPAAFHEIVRTAMYLLLKPYHESKKCRYVIKPIFFILNIASDIHHVVRSSRSFFIYRQPLKMIHAHERAFGPTLLFQAIRLVFHFNCWDEGQELIGFHRDPYIARCANIYLKPTMFETCCVIWADNIINYFRQAKKITIPAYMYDKLFENKEAFCADVLDMCRIPVDRLPAAIECLNRDSQDGSMFSQSLLKPRKFSTVSSEQQYRLNRFCDAVQLPRLVFDPRERTPAPKKLLKLPFDLFLQTPNSQRLSDLSTSKNLIKPFPVQCMITPSD